MSGKVKLNPKYNVICTRVDDNTLKDLKAYCKIHKRSIAKLLEELIAKELYE